MSNKKCLVYETLGSVTDMKIVESASDNCVRLSGVFGVCGVKNGNNRIYNKENYGKMVENLQNVIVNEGCLGELEHPNTMNINLENVSHKIESIEMNEDGTITGTIRLLDTPKGKIAKAIVEGGCPLFISSRGAGSIDEGGNVTLSTIKTYDLVGTPGFSQAKLNLKENQTFESLNENLAIVFESDSDDLLGLGGDSSDDKKEDTKSDDTKSDDTKSEENKEDKNKEEKKEEKPEEKEGENSEEDNKDNNDKVTMEEIKKSIDALTDKVTSLEAELHVAKESLENNKVDYKLIQDWINEEFAPEFKEQIKESMDEMSDDIKTAINEAIETAIEENTNAIAEGVQNWVNEEFNNKVQNWVNEEFATKMKNWIAEEYSGELQNWIVEEFTPEVNNWITEEFSTTVNNWITEEFSSTINNWVTEEFGSTIEGWINEEFAPAHKETILKEAYENVNMFMEAKKTEKLDMIDRMLENLDSQTSTNVLESIVKEQEEQNKFKGVYVVENMPAQYKPVWNGLSESRQQEIIRSSRMYDFTKEGVLESFWNNANLNETIVKESNTTNDVVMNYQSNVAAQMKRFGKWNS